MALRKRDTSAGFRPVLPRGDDVRAASRDALRMDGRLDESVLGPSIHQLLLSMARIRNAVSTLRIEGERIDLEGARRALEWVLARDASSFAFGDYPNPQGYSRESIRESLGQLVAQGVLEPMGERRGRRYKLGTAFLARVYGGDL